MERYISIGSLIISIVSLYLVISQVRVSVKTMKTQIAVSLMDQLYSDEIVQKILRLIYSSKIKFAEGELFEVIDGEDSKLITPKIDIFLNRFQIIGHLFELKVLNKRDLRGIRYEIIMIGRNEALRQYFTYLNTNPMIQEVEHDHFAYFKELYLTFEDDSLHRGSFSECIYNPQKVRVMAASA